MDVLSNSGVTLDPEMRDYIARVDSASAQYPNLMELPLSEARRISDMVNVPLGAGGPEMERTVERWVQVCGRYMLVRCHHPKGVREPAPVMIYLHGGGWTWNSIFTHDRLMRDYASGSGCAVFGADYSLSPEAKFPQALNECVELVRWLARFGSDWGIDPGRILLGGDSAGANLALATALTLRDAGESHLRGLLLNYGVFDSDFDTPSYAAYGGGGLLLTTAKMRFFWNNYVERAEQMRDPLAAPVHADLTGLPPVLLHIAELDVLYDENVALARRLEEAGADVQATVFSGVTHGFLRAAPFVSKGREAIAEAVDWMARSTAV